jgi:hypothetical protein
MGADFMQRWMMKVRLLACGGVTLGILQAIDAIDFNQIWFNFLYVILNALVTLLLGGDLGTITDTGTSSPFGSFFL